MYYCGLSLGVLQHILPRFLVTCAIWCVLEYSFRELSLNSLTLRHMILDNPYTWYSG